MSIDFEKLDPEIMQYCKEQEALLHQEKNKTALLEGQLKKAKQTAIQIRKENEFHDEMMLLRMVNHNAQVAREAVEKEAARRKKQEEKERVLADLHYLSCQQNIKKLAITISVAIIVISVCIIIKASNQIASYSAISLSGASVGYFLNDFVRLAGKRGSHNG